MSREITTFNQLLKLVSRSDFAACVDRYSADKYVKGFSTWSQFVALVYAQISRKRSLRETEASFNSHTEAHYHLNCDELKRSTFSDANNKRPCEVYEDLLRLLIKKASRNFRKSNKEILEVLDSTQIRLNETLYSWAAKGHRLFGIKAHVAYGLAGGVPEHLHISNANVNDCSLFEHMAFKPGVTYLFDKGYNDFEGWKKIIDSDAHFVTRAKKNLAHTVISEEIEDLGEHVLSDKLIKLRSPNSHILKGQAFRLIECKDDEGRVYRLISDRLGDSAEELIKLYKKRWQIELFFKWIKQNLKIKRFLGRSLNSVRTQVAIAFITYLLLKMLHELTQETKKLTYYCSAVTARLMKPFKEKKIKRPKIRPKPLWQEEFSI